MRRHTGYRSKIFLCYIVILVRFLIGKSRGLLVKRENLQIYTKFLTAFILCFSMPIYHENCGKPGPGSTSYVPPPEARLFKSRSAPASPRFDDQRFSRSASFRQPRQTRSSYLLREAQMKKAEKSKLEKSSKLGRSKSFTSRLTSKFYQRGECPVFITKLNLYNITIEYCANQYMNQESRKLRDFTAPSQYWVGGSRQIFVLRNLLNAKSRVV